MIRQSLAVNSCIAVLLGSWAMAASAAPGLDACIAIDDAAARLACYDQLAGRAKPSGPTPVVGEAAASAAAMQAPVASPGSSDGERDFGLTEVEVKRRDPDQWSASRPESIVRTIKSVSRDGYGRFVLTLDDGQVWGQTEIIAGMYPRAGESVTITQGQLGGFALRSERFGTVRVRRIR